MHSNHNVFVQGIEQKRRIKFAFFSGKNLKKLVRECVPLHYSSKGQIKGDNRNYYYIWDFVATNGSHFLALLPSQILSMELTEETFTKEDCKVFAEIQQSD